MNQSAAAPLADIPLSTSVEKALSGLSESAEVSSWGIVKELIKVHPDYGRDLGHKLLATPGPTVSQHRSLADWLADTYALFDKHKISELKTRWVILGLSQLDPDLAGYLDSFDYREALKSELKEPFESLLAAPPQTSETPPNLASTSKAQTQTKSQADTPTPHLPPDPTVLLTDTPSPKDQLGRLGLAQALAEWLQRFWKEANPAPGKGDGPRWLRYLWPSVDEVRGQSFTMHLHGSWGAGKTTLLRLLQIELQQGTYDDWVVVWFNAWQHQHLEPAWWPLLDRVYREAVAQLAAKYKRRSQALSLRVWEGWWRFRVTGRFQYVVALVASLLIFLFLVVWIIQTDIPAGSSFLDTAEGVAKTMGAVASLIVAAWAGALTLIRSFTLGSASSAQTFVEVGQNPMEQVRRHYQALLQKIGRPVIVYVDDLDRCRVAHVVNLLEGMQTLFNDSRVFYVVAADRRWLYVCFETSYKDFADHIIEPGRRLGYLFLEKAFQLSVSVPPVSNEVQAAYLDYLLRGEQSNIDQALEAERRAARQEFANVRNEDEAIAKLQAPPKDSTQTPVQESLRNLVRKEAVIQQLASQEADKSTQVFLQPFAPLLERNPRAMKRLVNAYGIYRALALLDDVTLISDVSKRKQLALWTIVSLRWPSLAEYLERHPKTVESLRKPRGKLDDLKPIKELDLLVQTGLDDVRQVLNGEAEGVDVTLDEAAILRLIGIKASHSTPAVVA